MAAGLGEAAGIAGLLSLAGQTLQAASTIYGFVHSYKSVSAEIASIAGETLRLQDLLVHVRKFVADIGVFNAPSPDIVARLRIEITTCQADLERWNAGIEALRDTHCAWPRKLLQRVKIASEKGFFSPIRLGISAHLENIGTILGLLTCDTEFHLLLQVSTTKAVVNDIRSGQADSTKDIFNVFSNLQVKHDSHHQIQAQSLSLLQQKLDILGTRNGTDHAETQRSLANIEASLASVQGRLHHSTRAPRQRRAKNAAFALPYRQFRQAQGRTAIPKHAGFDLESRNISNPQLQPIPLRLIKPCVLIYEDSGRLFHEVSAHEDRRASRLCFEERLALLQYIQKLRLIIWLLRKQSLLTLTAAKDQNSLPSSLSVQAGLASSWQRGVAFGHMMIALKGDAACMDQMIPWVIDRHWLQYIFDRLADEGAGLPVMALVLRHWERFPAPRGTEVASYNLPWLQQIFNRLTDEEDELKMTVLVFQHWAHFPPPTENQAESYSLPWLQYVFDRMADEGNGLSMMALILRHWQYFLHPTRKQMAFQKLNIP